MNQARNGVVTEAADAPAATSNRFRCIFAQVQEFFLFFFFNDYQKAKM